MPKPTAQQLEKINKFTLVPRTEDNTYVFPDLMIDNQITSYSSRLHENLLTKFVSDANKGVGLLMNHNHRSLPVGRTFEAEIKKESGDGGDMFTVYCSHYIDLGRNTESGMSTDDVAKGIDAGTIFDTSVGFNAKSWKCNICNFDIRDWMNCSHYPGETYEIKGSDGVIRNVLCVVEAGADGVGELLENSLVYAGACNRATIKQDFSASVGETVTDSKYGSKLHAVDNFKNIPLNATIYQYYTKDGSVLFTETPERTDGVLELQRRSEEEVDLKQFLAVLAKYGITVETPEQLEAAIEAFKTNETALATETEKNGTLTTDLATAKGETEAAVKLAADKEITIGELTIANKELAEKAGVAETYTQDLITKALELGVRAQGNAFNTEMFTKFLGTLSIEDIKTVIAGFEAEVQTRFAGSRTTDATAPRRNLSGNEPTSREDFETEEEFRNQVADEATKLSAEKGISLKDATKEVYAKYTQKGSEE